MPSQLKDGRWKCDFCEFVQSKEGWVKNHEVQKHSGGDGSEVRQKKERKIEKNGGLVCPDCKGKNIRLLSSNNSTEKEIMEMYNLKYLCLKCEEVF